MRAVVVFLGVWLLSGCTQDRAHRDCDRTLVPINVLPQEELMHSDDGSSTESDAELE
ncbi:hypothetical protein [Povalibacter sp.]|uniref:hypothetical protein n=1 Tax=Povalibacter sp. TaxID=1962978 RepID=UPI002F3F3AC2